MLRKEKERSEKDRREGGEFDGYEGRFSSYEDEIDVVLKIFSSFFFLFLYRRLLKNIRIYKLLEIIRGERGNVDIHRSCCTVTL